jgi:hypothetical protein
MLLPVLCFAPIRLKAKLDALVGTFAMFCSEELFRVTNTIEPLLPS